MGIVAQKIYEDSTPVKEKARRRWLRQESLRRESRSGTRADDGEGAGIGEGASDGVSEFTALRRTFLKLCWGRVRSAGGRRQGK